MSFCIYKNFWYIQKVIFAKCVGRFMNLAAKQSFRVVTYLLMHEESTQLGISEETGVSLYQVHDVVKYLTDVAILREGRKKGARVVLSDPIRLLDAVSLDRPLSRLIVDTIRLELTDVAEAEKLIANVSKKQNLHYAFTCFSGLNKYMEYYISYPTVHVYSAKAEKIARTLPLGRGTTTVNILRADQSQFEQVKTVRGSSIVTPLQVVIDLFCLGAEGRDGAIKLYESLKKVAKRRTKR